MSGRRERWGIMGAILGAIEAEGGRVGAVRLTMVASHANIAYDRLLEYLGQLESMGLTSGRPPRLTAQGEEFLSHYRHWLNVLQRYGFEAAEASTVALSPRDLLSEGGPDLMKTQKGPRLAASGAVAEIGDAADPSPSG